MTPLTPSRFPYAAASGALAALLLAFSANVAHASPTFPAEVQRQLNMPCVPQCTLCHRDVNGGIGTVTQPFGQAMRAVGLKAKHPESIAPALGTLEQASTDSDGDGRPDVEELREGSNPNQAGGGVLCATYGCSTRMPAPPASGASATLLFFVAGSFVARARRWRRRAHRHGASK